MASFKDILRRTPDLLFSNLHFVFAAVAVVFCICLSFMVPAGFGNDEPVHAFRAESISRGHLLPRQIGPWHASGVPITVYGNYTADNLVNLEQTGDTLKLKYVCSAGITCPAMSSHDRQLLNSAGARQLKNAHYALLDYWGANTYSPIGYLPAAIGFKLSTFGNLSVWHAVVLARFCNALGFIMLVTFALYLLRRSRTRWLILSIALLPITLLGASTLGVDGMLDALALLLFALSAHFLTQTNTGRNERLVLLLCVVAIALPLIKLPYVVLSLLALALPVFPAGKKGLWLRSATGALIVLPALAWSLVSLDASRTQSITVHAGTAVPSTTGQLKYIALHPVQYFGTTTSSLLHQDWIGSLAAFTQQGFRLPITLLLPSCLLVFTAALLVSDEGFAYRNKKLVALVSLAGALLTLGAIVTALYATYNPVGSASVLGVQGRYLIPMLPFAGLSIGLLLAQKTTGSRATKSAFLLAHVVILGATLYAYSSVVG